MPGTVADRLVDIAQQVTGAHEAGRNVVTVAGVTFDTVRTGYCTRFVRLVHEAALGIAPFAWAFAAGNARECEGLLKAAGKRVDWPRAGAVVCMNRTTSAYGHIGLCLSETEIAENTSSRSRGPGTVRSALSSVRGIVSGYYWGLQRAGRRGA